MIRYICCKFYVHNRSNSNEVYFKGRRGCKTVLKQKGLKTFKLSKIKYLVVVSKKKNAR